MQIEDFMIVFHCSGHTAHVSCTFSVVQKPIHWVNAVRGRLFDGLGTEGREGLSFNLLHAESMGALCGSAECFPLTFRIVRKWIERGQDGVYFAITGLNQARVREENLKLEINRV